MQEKRFVKPLQTLPALFNLRMNLESNIAFKVSCIRDHHKRVREKTTKAF